MTVLTDFPERLHPGIVVFVGPDHQPMRIIQSRWHQKRMLVRMEGFTTREEVAALRNMVVAVRADDRPELPPGEYYHHQILGLQVITDQGQPLGRLVEIIETGANDVYVVRSESGVEILLPAIEEVILDIDLGLGEIQVHLLPGLQKE